MAGAIGLIVSIAGGVAAAAPLPPDKLDIPLFVDESVGSIGLRNHDDTYGFEARGQMWGVRSPSDQLRLEWRQRGKLLATASCRLTMHRGDDPSAGYECRHDDGLKAAGPVEANLIFKDERDDKEYLVRTFKVDVKHFAKGTWQITSDDLLADAWARHVTAEPHASSVYFRFWMTGRLPASAMLRCTANGSPVPDVPVTLIPRGGFAADIIPTKGARQTWTWSLVELQTDRLHHGTKRNPQPEDVFLIDNPGNWICQLRESGRNLRTLLFAVDDQGMVASHPLQGAAGMPRLWPGVALIDVRIPREAGIDQRIKPAALAKSHLFGLPWPKHPAIKERLAALPPAIENANPVPPPLPKGKRLSGLEHSPPRFVDETTTHVTVLGEKTYTFRVFARVAGVTAAADRIRVDWRQGKKVLASVPCAIDRDDTLALVDCRFEKYPGLTAKGKIEADLVYLDDSDRNEYLLRTYKLDVVKFRGDVEGPYQILGDDLLGAAWAVHNYPLELSELVNGRPGFMLWLAPSINVTGDEVFRCTVDGTKIEDIPATSGTSAGGSVSIEASTTRKGKSLLYRWRRFEVIPRVQIGSHTEYNSPKRDDIKWLADMPGKWDCMWRVDGNNLRELIFTVNAKGRIEANPDLVDPKVPTLDFVVPVEMRIPKNSKYDARIRPAAMKQSRWFGLPWPSTPGVKAMHAAFPPASGLPDPK